MRHPLFILLTFLGSLALSAQTYDTPESIELDTAHNRWLISNKGAGEILARDRATGALSLFTGLPSSPHGLEIVDTILYVCDGARIKGYGLASAAEVVNLNLGASFLNGITHDDTGNLFATDFTGKKIYHVFPAADTFFVFASGLAKSPNGIFYDGANNRCVFVNWGTSANIMQVSLLDSSVSVAKATSLSNIDGITRDGAGNWFVASWGINGVSMFDSGFTTGPTTVISGLSSPADIAYDVATDTLAVPNSGSSLNKCTFHYMGSVVGISPSASEESISIGPNPSSGMISIRVNQEHIGAEYSIHNLHGQVCQSGVIMHDAFSIDLGDLPRGIYHIRVGTAGTAKMLLLGE